MIEDTASALVPTQNNIVGKRHCRVLISNNNSDATYLDLSLGQVVAPLPMP
jgi:hypothetical protein